MKLNWDFLRGGGGGGATQKPSVRGVWIFSGTVQFTIIFGNALLMQSD